MKLNLLIIGLLTILITACKNGEIVNEKIEESFSKKFPNATKIHWDKESENEWESEFELNNIEYSANFDLNGVWIETEHEIETSKVPNKVLHTVNSNYAKYKIIKIELSETKNGSVYELELKNENLEIEIKINSNGIVKKESNMEENH